MNLRRLPIFSTIVVLIAAGVMVWLGFWQLGRAEEKAALIAKYEANEGLPVIADFQPFDRPDPVNDDAITNYDRSYLEEMKFRRVEFDCREPKGWQVVAGRNENGASGYSHMFECDKFYTQFLGEQDLEVRMFVAVGWSRSIEPVEWNGGKVKGIFSTHGGDYKIVASEPLAGLQPLAKPDPRDLPNNHLAYTGQWFFFALTALVIYFLAIRKKLSERREGE